MRTFKERYADYRTRHDVVHSFVLAAPVAWLILFGAILGIGIGFLI